MTRAPPGRLATAARPEPVPGPGRAGERVRPPWAAGSRWGVELGRADHGPGLPEDASQRGHHSPQGPSGGHEGGGTSPFHRRDGTLPHLCPAACPSVSRLPSAPQNLWPRQTRQAPPRRPRDPAPLTISASAEMTFPSVVRDLLMLAPSCAGRRAGRQAASGTSCPAPSPGADGAGPRGRGRPLRQRAEAHRAGRAVRPVSPRLPGNPGSASHGPPGSLQGPFPPTRPAGLKALLVEADAFLTPKTAGPGRGTLRTPASRPHRRPAAVPSVGKAAEGLAFPPGWPLAAGCSTTQHGTLERGRRSALP